MNGLSEWLLIGDQEYYASQLEPSAKEIARGFKAQVPSLMKDLTHLEVRDAAAVLGIKLRRGGRLVALPTERFGGLSPLSAIFMQIARKRGIPREALSSFQATQAVPRLHRTNHYQSQGSWQLTGSCLHLARDFCNVRNQRPD